MTPGIGRCAQGRGSRRVAALQLAMSVSLASLLVGIVYVLLARALLLIGKTELHRAAPSVPEQAVHSTKEDVAWLKSQAKFANR
jgi:hypothetical protein